jgi:two-component sensor histidine kinase
MKWPSLHRRLVLYIAAGSFILMMAVQYVWLDNTYRLKEKEFDETVKNTLRFFNNDFQSNTVVAANMQMVFKDHSYISKAQPVIKYAIDTCFQNKNLPTDYAYGISEHKSDHKSGHKNDIFWSSDPAYRDSLSKSKLSIIGLCMGDKGALEVKFFFPHKRSYLFSKLTPLLLFSGFSFVVLLFCFVSLIIILKKQAKLSVLKNDFINNMTHELKTPLFTISIASRMLAKEYEENRNAKPAKYTNSIQQEVKRLNTLVENILQTSLLEQKRLNLDKKTMDIHAAIQRAAEGFELIRQEKGGTISLSLDAKMHHIVADETHIVNTIYNLLDNAFKYTEKQPHIVITTKNIGNAIALTIKDNGIGFNAETKALVFERFFRAHTGNVHNVKGFGIGLSYVKSVVEAHNGFLSVNSHLNKGSEFTLQLPYEQ